MAYYITSDLHLMHKKICGPEGFVEARKHFKNEVEMTEYLIDIHNKYVNQDDVVYNLGDLTMLGSKPEEIKGMLDRMNGSLVLVKGNHDNRRLLKYLENNNYKLPNGKDKFTIHEVGFTIKQAGVTYYLTHYPMQVGHLRNNLRSFHGHIHEDRTNLANALNVGIDSPELPHGLDFGQPIPLQVAIDHLERKVSNAKSEWNANVERQRAHKGQLQFDI